MTDLALSRIGIPLAACWLVGATSISGVLWGSEPSLQWTLPAVLLGLTHLASLAGLFRGVLLLIDPSSAGKPLERSALIRGAVFWATLKVLAFGSLLFFLHSAREAPIPPLLLGLSTWVVLPLAYGGILVGLRRTS